MTGMPRLGRDTNLRKVFDVTTGSVGKASARNVAMLGVLVMSTNMTAGICIVSPSSTTTVLHETSLVATFKTIPDFTLVCYLNHKKPSADPG
jgi:hypothetical protein